MGIRSLGLKLAPLLPGKWQDWSREGWRDLKQPQSLWEGSEVTSRSPESQTGSLFTWLNCFPKTKAAACFYCLKIKGYVQFYTKIAWGFDLIVVGWGLGIHIDFFSQRKWGGSLRTKFWFLFLQIYPSMKVENNSTLRLSFFLFYLEGCVRVCLTPEYNFSEQSLTYRLWSSGLLCGRSRFRGNLFYSSHFNAAAHKTLIMIDLHLGEAECRTSTYVAHWLPELRLIKHQTVFLRGQTPLAAKLG